MMDGWMMMSEGVCVCFNKARVGGFLARLLGVRARVLTIYLSE